MKKIAIVNLSGLEDKELVGLIMFKVYLQAKGKESLADCLYDYFGIEERPGITNIDRKLKSRDREITGTINDLHLMITSGLRHLMPNGEARHPGVDMWIHDIFGEDASLYIPGWIAPERRNQRKPNYKKRLDLLKRRFGETYKS